MAESEDKASRTEEPTKRRLEDARRKGDVAKSPDVAAFTALAGASLVVLTLGAPLSRSMAESLAPFLEHPDAFDLSGPGAIGVARLALQASAPAAIVLGAAAICGVAGNVIQHGFLWAGGKLAPDASRINPVSGFKRVFGLDGLSAFLKSLIKVIAVGVMAWTILKPRWGALETLAFLDPAAILPLCAEVLRALLIAILVVMGVVAAADWLWQRHRFMVRLRMSREEIKEETKDTEGDPHIKAKLRQQRMSRSRRRMMQNVQKATVVVMNPTHYAVALRYVQGETAAPICVAKGLDALALRIREAAEGLSIPVVEDPPLARALYAAIDIDQTIPREHFEAVARIVGFVLNRGARRPRPATQANADLRPRRL